MKKTIILLLAFALFTSCGTVPANPIVVEAPEEEPLPVTLTVSVDELPAQDDPISSGFGEVSPVFTACYEGLFSYDSVTGALVPAICSDYNVSEDGLTYTFELRSNAKYSNGEPIVADDFVKTFFRLMDGEGDPLVGERLVSMISGAQDYTLPEGDRPEDFDVSQVGIYDNGSYELEVILTEPSSEFVAMLASPAFAPTYQKADVPTSDTESEELVPIHVASGPFVMVSQNSGEVVAVKNNNYYNMLEVTVEQVRFSTEFLDESLGFSNGEINVVMNPETALLSTFNTNSVVVPSFDTAFLAFNTQKSPTNNIQVRNAISLAIDREELINDVIPGEVMPANGLVAPGYIYGDDDFTNILERKNFELSDNIEESQQALVSARFRDGVGLNLIMIVPQDDAYLAYYNELAEMVRQTTRGTVDLVELSEREYTEALEIGSYNIAVGYAKPGVLHPAEPLSIFHSENPENYTGYDDNLYDEMLQTAAISPDGVGNKEQLQKAEVHLMANLPITPLFYPAQNILINNNTDGCMINALGNLYITNAYVEQEDGEYQVDGF